MDYQKRRQITQIVANPLTRQRRAIYCILGVALVLGLLLALARCWHRAGSAQIFSLFTDYLPSFNPQVIRFTLVALSTSVA